MVMITHFPDHRGQASRATLMPTSSLYVSLSVLLTLSHGHRQETQSEWLSEWVSVCVSCPLYWFSNLFTQNFGTSVRQDLIQTGLQAKTRKVILPHFSLSSVAQSCLTLCDPMNRSMPDLPIHHQLPEFTQTHVHWVGDAIQPSHPLSPPSPAPNLSQYQGLFQWVSSSHQVAKALEFQLQHQSFQWTPRTDLL